MGEQEMSGSVLERVVSDMGDDEEPGGEVEEPQDDLVKFKELPKLQF
jgi:hypothetical protein